MQSHLNGLPAGFEASMTNLLKEIDPVEGYLSPIEIRFSAHMTASPTTTGEILAIDPEAWRDTVV